MNIFVAASWSDRWVAKQIAQSLQKHGIEITSKWWTHEDSTKSEDWCNDDITNMENADILVIYNSGKKTGGKHVELGMAIMRDIPILVFGQPLTTVYRHRTKFIETFSITETKNAILDYIY
jgi:ATP adenylyltransferase/5',5'''-P-1,P-4-tetraphosphate phosphorylase II